MSERSERERQLKPVLWGAGAVLVLALVAFLAVGANGPADPTLGPAPAGGTVPPGGQPAAPRQPVEGFGEIAFTLGDGAERCALLAETDTQHQRGLMGRSDLSGYDGMIFRFPADTTGTFFMRNVPMVLEIAWFDRDGQLVSTTEMAPCEDREGCPTYAAAGPYRVALEVEAGGLARLGVGQGSVLTLGGACAPSP